MRDVLTFGEAMAVFFPAASQRPRRDVAGSELNVAVALARLGRDVTYVTRVGDDPFGEAVRDVLAAERVDAHLRVDPVRRTGIYFRDLGRDGSRRVLYYRAGSAAAALGPGDLPPEGGHRLVHATGITVALSASCRAAVEVVAATAPRFSLDVNHRQALWPADACRAAIVELLPWAELVFLSDEDLAVVTPADALAAGAGAVVHTRGADGATFHGGDGTVVAAPAPPVEVRDTVGAGDAFAAGFLDAWLAGRRPDEALAAGCRLGAAAVAVEGDRPPRSAFTPS